MKYANKKIFYLTLLLIFLVTSIKPTQNRKQKFSLPNLFAKNTKHQEKESKPSLAANSEKDIYQWLRTVSEVVSLVEKKAFRAVDFSSFIQEALKAAVPHVDAHSAFFSKESYKTAIETTSGEFSGIGVSIISKAPEDDTLVIVEVIRGGPADKGGLKGGDKIVEVDGEKLRGLSTDEVINKLKGKVKTELKLKIIRDKKPLEFKVKREIIKDQTSSCFYFKDQDIYYLKLQIFTETAPRQVSELLKKANEGKCKGIVLDLRRNPGGILDSAVDMAGLFLPKNSLVVSTKDKDLKEVSKYHTKAEPVLKSDIPIFVLIDNFTASASEILAGCLKYYSDKTSTDTKKNARKMMVFLLGTPTFGKGSVQEVIPISNGCALKLTTMLYYLPNQESIQAVGIEPDFLIKPKIIPSEELKWIQELYGKETSLKHHITEEETEKKEEKTKKKEKSETKEKKEKEEEEKSWDEKQLEAINQDVQIKAAINMINMLALAKKHMPKTVDTRPKAVSFLKQNYLTDEKFELEKVK